MTKIKMLKNFIKKFLNYDAKGNSISTVLMDTTENAPVPGGGGDAVWGSIKGDIADQTDLQEQLSDIASGDKIFVATKDVTTSSEIIDALNNRKALFFSKGDSDTSQILPICQVLSSSRWIRVVVMDGMSLTAYQVRKGNPSVWAEMETVTMSTEPTKITDDTSKYVTLDKVKNNHIYEYTQPLTSLTVTTVEAGTTSIIFKSGSTATILTLPNTVIQPDGFAVKANKMYELNITDNRMVVGEWGV